MPVSGRDASSARWTVDRILARSLGWTYVRQVYDLAEMVTPPRTHSSGVNCRTGCGEPSSVRRTSTRPVHTVYPTIRVPLNTASLEPFQLGEYPSLPLIPTRLGLVHVPRTLPLSQPLEQTQLPRFTAICGSSRCALSRDRNGRSPSTIVIRWRRLILDLTNGLRLGLTVLRFLLDSFLAVSDCFRSKTEPIFPLPVEDAVDIVTPLLQCHERSGQDPAQTALVLVLYATQHTHELRRSASSALCDLSRMLQSACAMLSSVSVFHPWRLAPAPSWLTRNHLASPLWKQSRRRSCPSCLP